MTKEARVALRQAADTIELLLQKKAELEEKIAGYQKIERARRLASTMSANGWVEGGSVLSEDDIQKLASSDDLDKYEAVLPKLAPQTPLWKQADAPNASKSAADEFNNWVLSGTTGS